ncbi:venom protein 302-like [Dendronephthya gigantea]|uniref:venom protein 302-like n=1 Tax=Dendronephthya gigantea TaxID=151771 RepID=UPI00106BE8F1|nr:venom protein 302-like [Dendronephthya gigantea]
MKTIFLTALVFSAILSTTEALSCLQCPQVTCRLPSELNCKGGLAREPCGCCDECAKVEEETCGGPWDMAGVCDTGLKCVYKGGNEHDSNAPGVCKKLRKLFKTTN